MEKQRREEKKRPTPKFESQQTTICKAKKFRIASNLLNRIKYSTAKTFRTQSNSHKQHQQQQRQQNKRIDKGRAKRIYNAQMTDSIRNGTERDTHTQNAHHL